MKRIFDASAAVRSEVRALRAYHLEQTPSQFKLDQNEAMRDLPRRLKERAAQRWLATDWSRYPDFHGESLRRALASRHGWKASGVLVGNGSNELLSVCLTALGGPGRTVVTTRPSFSLYRSLIQLSGASPELLGPRPDLSLPYSELRAAVERHPERPVLLCSPNNPTGDALRPAQVDRLLSSMTAPLLLDNAYGEFCRWDYRPLLAKHRHLVLLRTFSKAWSLGGLRLGYLLADPALVAEFIKVKLPYNVGHQGLVVGTTVLEAALVVERAIRATIGRRSSWRRLFEEAGIEVLPSEANFLLLRLPTPHQAKALRDGLAERGILVRDVSSNPELAGCLRVAVGDGRALRAVSGVLPEVLAEAVAVAGDEALGGTESSNLANGANGNRRGQDR